MHSDIEALEIVCQHYRRHFAEAELRRLKNMTCRLHSEIVRFQCELGILSKGELCLECGCKARGSAVRHEPTLLYYTALAREGRQSS
jgi:hypothetical protein